jgi:hypothetical protein
MGTWFFVSDPYHYLPFGGFGLRKGPKWRHSAAYPLATRMARFPDGGFPGLAAGRYMELELRFQGRRRTPELATGGAAARESTAAASCSRVSFASYLPLTIRCCC